MNDRLAKILAQDSLTAAPLLLGWVLCRRASQGIVKFKIVETEAYHQADPASHSFHGLTRRTAPMFEAGGHLYVYFTYGMHYALNLVSGPAGVGEGVLIRAGEPLVGIEIMKQNRGVNEIKNLSNGPGKLAQALGISSTELSGKTIGEDTVWLELPEQLIDKSDIIIGPRIGVSKAASVQARFYIKNSPFVSKL